jgi:hypothetical protein
VPLFYFFLFFFFAGILPTAIWGEKNNIIILCLAKPFSMKGDKETIP